MEVQAWLGIPSGAPRFQLVRRQAPPGFFIHKKMLSLVLLYSDIRHSRGGTGEDPDPETDTVINMKYNFIAMLINI